MIEDTEKKEPIRYPLIFTRLVDGVLQNLLDLAFRDFVASWLKDVAIGADELINAAKQDVWGAIQGIHERAIKIDQTSLVACKMVEKITIHLEKIKNEYVLSLDLRLMSIIDCEFNFHLFIQG